MRGPHRLTSVALAVMSLAACSPAGGVPTTARSSSDAPATGSADAQRQALTREAAAPCTAPGATGTAFSGSEPRGAAPTVRAVIPVGWTSVADSSDGVVLHLRHAYPVAAVELVMVVEPEEDHDPAVNLAGEVAHELSQDGPVGAVSPCVVAGESGAVFAAQSASGHGLHYVFKHAGFQYVVTVTHPNPAPLDAQTVADVHRLLGSLHL
jgi:hypothetical protein